MSCPCGAFLRRWNSRLLLMYSSAIIIWSPPLRAEADDILCRVDHLPVTVDPGENWSIRHSSAVGINTVTGHGSLSDPNGASVPQAELTPLSSPYWYLYTLGSSALISSP